MINLKGFKKINGVIIYACNFTISNWIQFDGMILATPQKSHGYCKSVEDFVRGKAITDVASWELIKLWPHRTRKSDYTTEKHLRSELEKRGFALNPQGMWVQQPFNPAYALNGYVEKENQLPDSW